MKKRNHRVFLFLTGFTIGWIFTILFNETPVKIQHSGRPNNIINSSYSSIDSVRKIRILCFLNTSPTNHLRKAVHIRNLWAKHCDKLLFASTVTDNNLGSIGFNVTDDHNNLWGKVKQMLQHVYKHYLDDFDWVFKGDDDTFAIVENMRFLLAAYSPDDPIYFGHKFNTSEHKNGHFSGGSGYVMSKFALRTFVEKLLTNTSLCKVGRDDWVEDWEISLCFDNVNIYPGDGRDLLKRERFLPFWPEAHLFPDNGLQWYWDRKYYRTDEGLDCCSNYTIAYHYTSPRSMYLLYYLVYHMRVYGVNHRYSLPPRKTNITEVIHILEQQRFNSTFFN